MLRKYKADLWTLYAPHTDFVVFAAERQEGMSPATWNCCCRKDEMKKGSDNAALQSRFHHSIE